MNSLKDIAIFVAKKLDFFRILPKNYLKNKNTFQKMLWSLHNRIYREHGFARIITIYGFNKKWQCFQICQYLLKMVAILFVTMETGGLAEKSYIYILLSKTNFMHWAKKMNCLHKLKNNPIYLPYLALTHICWNVLWPTC